MLVQLTVLKAGHHGDGATVTTTSKTEHTQEPQAQKMEVKLVLSHPLSLKPNPVLHLSLKIVHFMDLLVQQMPAVLIHSNVLKIFVS